LRAAIVVPLPGRSHSLEPRPQLFGGAGKRQERRGPERGTAGREEQGLEGCNPKGAAVASSCRQARRGANRREGSQTLGAEGAGGWNLRVDRILRVGSCRREGNSTRVVPRNHALCAQAAGGRQRPETPRTSQACERRVPVLRHRAEPAAGRPQGGLNREGGAQNRISATSAGVAETRVNVEGVRFPSGDGRKSGLWARKALDERLKDVKAFLYGNVSVVGLLALKTVYTSVGLVV
jgi:hypothetical protein